MGPKSTADGQIPRNLRTMYVHAYQSYIWNLVVSERIKLSSTKPLVGDLVFADQSADDEQGTCELSDLEPRKCMSEARADNKVDETSKGWRPSHQTSSSQEVKQLTEEDLPNYTIHDVLMPLPGWNIDYPAGEIGELYTKILQADGLDPKRMQRDQRYVHIST
jgi:tRNA pseudouridine13 synthase